MPFDGNGATDLFMRDLDRGVTVMISVNIDGEHANGHSFDMHGGRDRRDGTDVAGDWLAVHHNTFRAAHVHAVVIRGRDDARDSRPVAVLVARTRGILARQRIADQIDPRQHAPGELEVVVVHTGIDDADAYGLIGRQRCA